MANTEVVQSNALPDATGNVISQMTQADFSGLMDYATTHAVPALISAGIGVGVVFIGYLVAKYVSRIVSLPIRRRVDETLGRFLGKAIFYTIIAGITAAVLTSLGAPLGGLAAMIAAAGFAIGLAFQGTLSNFASGVLMLVFRPFKVGDVVNAGGVFGKVNEIDLFTTTLDTPDNRRIIVPNSAIAGGTIENISFHLHRRIEVVVGVEYSADMDQTRSALELALASYAPQTVQGEGRGSQVILAGLGDSAVEWKVRMWVSAPDYFTMLELLTGEVKRQLDAVNIGIPFPQMDIHLVSEGSDGEQRRSRPRPAWREATAAPTGGLPYSRAS